jgi:hypothetical protein
MSEPKLGSAEMSAENLIRKGLERRERERQGRPPDIANLVGAPRSVPALIGLQVKTAKDRKRHAECCAAVESRMQTWRAQRERELASLPAKARDEFMRAEAPAERKRALEEGQFSADRDRVFQEIHAANDSAMASANLFLDGLALLNAATIESDKRTRYAATLRDALPAAVSLTIETAVATGNRDLLAAAAEKAATFNKSEREQMRVNPRDAANVLLGKDLRDAKAAILLIDLYAAEVAFERAKVSDGPISSLAKLEIGLRKKEIEAIAPELLANEDAA